MLFEDAGAYEVVATTDSRRALSLFRDFGPDLVLLDLHMPHVGGLEVLNQLRASIPAGEFLPVLILTGDVTRDARETAFRSGARDFLTKPLDPMEVLLRSRNLLEARFLHQEMERKVRERTSQLETSRLEIIERLSRTAEFRDDVTGEHTRRVGELAARLSDLLGLSEEMVERIRRASPLHDLGKVGIPDNILLKPGPLTVDEFDVIKTHTSIGAELLSGGASELMQMAEKIAASHHERWDGLGYPLGISGEDIPLAARVVAIADVFDALTHDRPYRKAQPVSEVLQVMTEASGSQFDPEIMEVFLGGRLFEPAGIPEATKDNRKAPLNAPESGWAGEDDRSRRDRAMR
jgi:putative two-component system response regulator